MEKTIFHSIFPQGVEKSRGFDFYTAKFTHFWKIFLPEALILREKPLFSVEKYVGNVDNF